MSEETTTDEENSIFGYVFKDAALLTEALTTPSFRMTEPGARDNQRLEFLGDAVLDFLAGDLLYRRFPDAAEGPLTVKRTHLVSAPALCAAAQRGGIAARLRRNRGAAPLPANAKVYADAIEAIIGAAWVDGGLDAARQIFDALALDANAEAGNWAKNPKGELQERTQAMKPIRVPVYTLLHTSGSSDHPTFRVKVEVAGLGGATAEGHSKREAESAAAAQMLAAIEAAQHAIETSQQS